MLEAPGTQRLDIRYDEPHANSAFEFNLRHCDVATAIKTIRETLNVLKDKFEEVFYCPGRAFFSGLGFSV
jgi:hypothetical protein